MTTVRRTAERDARHAPSAHASQDEATDRLYWLLMHLDPERTVSWGEVERRAITCVADDPSSPWRLLEGAELEHVVGGLRGPRIARA